MERMKNNRKEYVKPSLERVELMVEETVLAFCKGPGFKGPVVGSCQSAGPGPCQTRGT